MCEVFEFISYLEGSKAVNCGDLEIFFFSFFLLSGLSDSIFLIWAGGSFHPAVNSFLFSPGPVGIDISGFPLEPEVPGGGGGRLTGGGGADIWIIYSSLNLESKSSLIEEIGLLVRYRMKKKEVGRIAQLQGHACWYPASLTCRPMGLDSNG